MFRIAKRGLSLAVMLAALFAAGCTTKAGWQYVPNSAQAARVRVPLTVAVEHFQDQRASENNHYFVLCVIPLVPYCSATYNRPENANGFLTAAAYNFRPSDDLAEATAIELRQSELFREVFVTNRTSDPGAQLTLRGTIINTDWDGTRYSYLLGPYGPLLWVFGLPLGSVQDTLVLRLELLETVSGRQLWTTDIHQDYSETEGLYYNYATDFGYPQMFRTGMQSALASLEAYVAQQPPAFWQHLESDSPPPLSAK
jgi:hypothetical protein